MALSVDRSVRPEISTAYARLEEKILERDQKGASDIFYDLVRAQVPLAALAGPILSLHAHEHRRDAADAARAGLPPLRPDHLVHADGPRALEPAPRQDAGPLRAAL